MRAATLKSRKGRGAALGAHDLGRPDHRKQSCVCGHKRFGRNEPFGTRGSQGPKPLADRASIGELDIPVFNDDLDGGTGSGTRDAGVPLPAGVGGGTPTVPATPPPSPVPATPCAHPVNFQHDNERDHGDEAIRVDLGWSSSTGSLADLNDCKIREVVDYDSIPRPPFNGFNPPDPTIIEIGATPGTAIDTHGYPAGLQNGISDPRVEGTSVANQVYQFKCSGSGCSNTWTDFPGHSYRITREVFAEFVRPNPWRYRITKEGTGSGNSFNYSREVEIPAP